MLVQEVGKGLAVSVVCKVGSEEGNTQAPPSPAVSITEMGELMAAASYSLAYSFGFEESSVTGDSVYSDFLFIEKDVVADFENSH